MENEKVKLWEHQKGILQALKLFAIQNDYKGRGYVVAPGGSGKTLIFSEIIKHLGVRTLVVSPSLVILEQNYQTFQEVAPAVSTSRYCTGEKQLLGEVVFTTYNSLVHLINQGQINSLDFQLIIFDEVHRCLSHKRESILPALDGLMIGFTATDKFNEIKNVKKTFHNEIYRMSLEEAIEKNICVPLRGFVVNTLIDVSQVNLSLAGNLNIGLAEKHLNIEGRNRIALDYYQQNFKGKATVIFCLSIKHAEDVCALFLSAGFSCVAVHGRMTQNQRILALRSFEEGKSDIICAVNTLLEGWDCNRVSLILNLRPTYSWVIAEQRAFRVSRQSPGKKCGIIVEFIDIFRKYDNPILVHHLFGIRNYRQGAYIAAPQKLKAKEKEDLEAGKTIKVSGNIEVGRTVNQVIDFVKTKRRPDQSLREDLRNPEIVKKILLSRKDIEYREIDAKNFFNLRFKSHGFEGNGETLMRYYYGTRGNEGRRAHNFQDFINEVLGDYFFYQMHEVTAPHCLREAAILDECDPYFSVLQTELKDITLNYLQRLHGTRDTSIFIKFFINEESCSNIANKYCYCRTWPGQLSRNLLTDLSRFKNLFSEFLEDMEKMPKNRRSIWQKNL